MVIWSMHMDRAPEASEPGVPDKPCQKTGPSKEDSSQDFNGTASGMQAGGATKKRIADGVVRPSVCGSPKKQKLSLPDRHDSPGPLTNGDGLSRGPVNGTGPPEGPLPGNGSPGVPANVDGLPGEPVGGDGVAAATVNRDGLPAGNGNQNAPPERAVEAESCQDTAQHDAGTSEDMEATHQPGNEQNMHEQRSGDKGETQQMVGDGQLAGIDPGTSGVGPSDTNAVVGSVDVREGDASTKLEAAEGTAGGAGSAEGGRSGSARTGAKQAGGKGPRAGVAKGNKAAAKGHAGAAPKQTQKSIRAFFAVPAKS
jgi:hypothetical protein